MKALVIDASLRIVETSRPRRRRGEALVRVTMAGVCNTDLELLQGYMGFRGIPGHEFVGVVEEADQEGLIGKRVVGEINCVCGACAHCRRGMPRHCTERTVLGILNRDGAFAEYLVLPEKNLHTVPENIEDEAAVFVEPIAAAFRIPEQIPVSKSDRIAVLGDGKLGQLIARVLALCSNHVLCICKHAWKRALLRDAGIDTASTEDAVEPGFDIVVEATGSPHGLARALELVRPEGTVVLKTTSADGAPLNLSLPVVVNEVRIVGSRCGPFVPAIDALARELIDVAPLITDRFSLADGVRALERAAEPEAMKVLVTM